MSSFGIVSRRSAGPARSDRACAVHATSREQSVTSFAVGIASAALLATSAQSPADARPALAPPAPLSAEEQREQVEAQKAKLDGLLKKQMELSAPVCSFSSFHMLYSCILCNICPCELSWAGGGGFRVNRCSDRSATRSAGIVRLLSTTLYQASQKAQL